MAAPVPAAPAWLADSLAPPARGAERLGCNVSTPGQGVGGGEEPRGCLDNSSDLRRSCPRPCRVTSHCTHIQPLGGIKFAGQVLCPAERVLYRSHLSF